MKKLSGLFLGDRVIWIVFFALCIISVVEVFSALSTLTYQSGSYVLPIARHAAFLITGFVVVQIVHRMPCRYFRAMLPFAVLASVLLLVLLQLGFGITLNGGARWFNLFGIPLQPSEIAKGTLVIYTALVLSWYQTDKGVAPGTFKRIFIPTLITCCLIGPENFSTAALLFLVITIMMFIGRVSVVSIGKMLGVIAIIISLCVVWLLSMSKEQSQEVAKLPFLFKRVPTWKSRLEDGLHSKNTKKLSPADFDIDAKAQRGHANIAIASSNIIGKGPGNSVQRDFIPQAYSDFIYAIIVEELGLVGATGVMILYLLLLLRVGYIARSFTESSFPPFLAMGLALLMVTQALANMFVAAGPFVTGQPLPLISRGGTSTLVNCAYIGMILSVSRLAKKQERKRKAATFIAPAVQPEMPETKEEHPEYIPPAEQTAREIASGNFETPDTEQE